MADDRISRMRQKQKGVMLQRPGVEPATPPVPASPPQNPKKAVGTMLTHACGHQRTVAKLESQPCLTCQDDARAKHIKAGRERRKKKTEGRRLPHEATYNVTYHAEAVLWTGTLSIGQRTWKASASGVFHLLSILDGMYRESLTEEEEVAQCK